MNALYRNSIENVSRAEFFQSGKNVSYEISLDFILHRLGSKFKENVGCRV